LRGCRRCRSRCKAATRRARPGSRFLERPGDRIKSDRKDAELPARLLLAGQLQAVAVPSPPFEAARHLARAREQVRGDLMRCRHRVSKLLLVHGRVYQGGAWTKRHRRWLAQQRFGEPAAEFAYLDCLAAVDGLVARKQALDERLSRLAFEGEWSQTVARLRCFRGIPRRATATPPLPTPPSARQTRQRHHRRRRPRARLLPLGRRRGRLTAINSRLLGRAPDHTLPARATALWATRNGDARS